MKKLISVLAALVLLFTAGTALAGDVDMSGICFKYMTNMWADPSTSVKVKGDVTAAQIETTILSGGAYGINCKLTRKASGSASYDARIIMTAPDGWSYTYTSRLNFSRSTEYVWFECLGTEFFAAYYSQFGSIEPGTYTVSLYLDNILSDTERFTVK